MERFTVAAVQMNALRGDIGHNIAVHESFTARAAAAGARLVVFPELSVTAHFGDPDATAFAAPAASGPVYDAMLHLAREHDIVVGYGFCEAAHGNYYNSFALMTPDGLAGVHRKVHASGDEYFYFRMGRAIETVDLGFARVGILICYDGTFFEAWRVLALQGADVILKPHAARSGRGEELPLDVQEEVIRKQLDSSKENEVYAAANGVYAVYANQYGYNGHSTHSGGAYIVGPRGDVIVRGEPKLEDLMITAELDPAALHDARNRQMSMKMRRPELYGKVTEML